MTSPIVLPEIELPDYRKIASEVKRKKIFVEEKEIENVLNWLQRSRAKFTLKNQPAQKGDFVEIEYWLDQLTIDSPQRDAFILGEGRFIAGFEEELIGMKAGEEKAEIVLKKEGKDIKIRLKVKSVQNVEFPEINDQFAQNLGKFENLDAFKKSIREGLNLEKAKSESIRIRNEILEKISQALNFKIPEVLVEQEKKGMLEDLKKNVSENLKMEFNQYLNKIRKQEKEILDSLLDQAKKRVKNFLILREIGKKEKIEVSEQELKEEVNKIKELDPERLKEYTKEAIRTEKIFQLLENLTPKL